MPVTPSGSFSEMIDTYRSMIANLAEWQAWAGADYADRIHFNENRDIAESDGLLIGNYKLPMPFVTLMIGGWRHEPFRCITMPEVILFFQDNVSDRRNHYDSYLDFCNNFGSVVDALSAHIREGTSEVPSIAMISMLSEPLRVNVLDGRFDHDYWTVSFKCEAER